MVVKAHIRGVLVLVSSVHFTGAEGASRPLSGSVHLKCMVPWQFILEVRKSAVRKCFGVPLVGQG